MSDPATSEAFNARFGESYSIEGFGLVGPDAVRVNAPCYFCAAPGFTVWRLVHNDEDMAKIATCSECGRSGHIHVEHDGDTTTGAFFQTGGPDAPAYLNPLIRRCEHGS